MSDLTTRLFVLAQVALQDAYGKLTATDSERGSETLEKVVITAAVLALAIAAAAAIKVAVDKYIGQI